MRVSSPIRIIFVVFIILSFTGCMTISDDAATYSHVEEFPELTADDIHVKSKEWIAYGFRSANHVIQHDDSTNGMLIVKGNMDVTYTFVPIATEFTLTIQSKDGRARMLFENPVILNANSSTNPFIPPRSPLTNKGQINSFHERAKEVTNTWISYIKEGRAADTDW